MARRKRRTLSYLAARRLSLNCALYSIKIEYHVPHALTLEVLQLVREFHGAFGLKRWACRPDITFEFANGRPNLTINHQHINKADWLQAILLKQIENYYDGLVELDYFDDIKEEITEREKARRKKYYANENQ